ncbi:hypothetical protein SNE40_008272 [Patella caerulea]|uniref:Uncharacterized protein n=1 Tax=Patella caerulea TaxID=87958 RepID=A0AAN8K7U5_PATCE
MSTRFHCSLCSNVYAAPKLLPCFHTFCEGCLYDFIGKNTKNEYFGCPSCKKQIFVPKNISKDFMTNYYVMADVEQHLHQADDVCLGICEICNDKNDAAYTCKDCEQKMCVSCYSVHSSMRATKNHDVLKLKLSPHKLIVQRNCEEHNEELHFYCRRCCKGMCVHCKVAQHDGHATEHVEDVTIDGRSNLKRMSETLNGHVRDLRCELEALAYRKRLVQKSCDETCSTIKKQAEDICTTVYQARNHKLHEATSFRDEQLLKIEETEKEIKDRELQMNTMSGFVRSVATSSSDVGVLETCDLIADKIQETEDYVCPSCDVESTEFEVEQPTEASIQNLFGRMSTYPTLRMRLSYGAADYFDSGSLEEKVDAICPIGNNLAWVGAHISSVDKSSVTLFNSKGEILKMLTCDQIVKCFALLDKSLHVLTKDAFLKLNEEETDLEYLVAASLPVLIASNATSMFYLSRDHVCQYVTNTNVRPIETTLLCSLKGLKNPTKMAVDDNQNIAIVDTTLKSVLVFDFDGAIQTKYSIKYQDFLPLDVCIDRWSDVLVVDGGNGAIHELASDGKGREIMYSRFSGLKNVCCIGGDEDTWWFGTTDGKIIVKYFT